MKGHTFRPWEFPRRLKHARLRAGLTVEDFALALGMSAQSVNTWERGRGMPDLFNFRRICVALQVSSDFLLNLTDEPAPRDFGS